MKKRLLFVFIIIFLFGILPFVSASLKDFGLEIISGFASGYKDPSCSGTCFDDGCPPCWTKTGVCGSEDSDVLGNFFRIITGSFLDSADCCVYACSDDEYCDNGVCVFDCSQISEAGCSAGEQTNCEDKTLYSCEFHDICGHTYWVEDRGVDCCNDNDCGDNELCFGSEGTEDYPSYTCYRIGVKKCQDGTHAGYCSTNKPYFCNTKLELIPYSSYCGCDVPYVADLSDDLCHVPYTCEDIGGMCILDISCNGTYSTTGFLTECCQGDCTFPDKGLAPPSPPTYPPVVCCIPNLPKLPDTVTPYSSGGSSGETINISDEEQINQSIFSPQKETCSDLTPYGLCSKNKPYKCVNGILWADAWECGCFPGYIPSKESRYVCEPVSKETMRNRFIENLQLDEVEEKIVTSPEYIEEMIPELEEELPGLLSPVYSPKLIEIKESVPEKPLFSPTPSGFFISMIKQEDPIEIETRIIDGVPKINFNFET